MDFAAQVKREFRKAGELHETIKKIRVIRFVREIGVKDFSTLE